ncbi:MAG: DUF1289 domain-containing protein [Neisseria sp.]|nr:DUF1289 domain-containing protein [Neisseria sp.]
MQQDDFFAIPSPCIGVCKVNNKGYCVGCFRSREERLYWLNFTDEQKHQVMALLAARRKKVAQMQWEKQQDYGDAPEQFEMFDK